MYWCHSKVIQQSEKFRYWSTFLYLNEHIRAKIQILCQDLQQLCNEAGYLSSRVQFNNELCPK